MFLGKDKLNTIEVLIYKALIKSYFIHDEFFSINNVLRDKKKISRKLCGTHYIEMVDLSRKRYAKKKWYRNNSR